MNKLRICIFTHTFPRYKGDTAAPFMGELAEAITRLGHKVYVLTPFDKNLDLRENKFFEVIPYKYIFPNSLHLLGYSRTLKGDKSMSFGALLLSPFMYFFGFLALLRLVRKEKINIISSHWIIPNGFISAIVSKISKIPFTVTVPGSDVYLGGKNIFFRWMVGVASKNASYVISDSTHYLKQLGDLGYFPNLVSIIPYGVNPEKFKITAKDLTVIKKLKSKANTPILLAVGRMVDKKGFKYLVEAMPKVLKQIPNARLVLVGDGEERRRLEEKVKEYKIERNVIFAGTVSYNELSKYYNFADIFVMPSIKDEKGNIDASPVAMMEAMMCGIPVVASRFSGSKDVVINGRTGYLVREKSSSDLTDSILKFFNEEKTGMTKANVRKIALENFSVNHSARKYISIFGETLKGV